MLHIQLPSIELETYEVCQEDDLECVICFESIQIEQSCKRLRCDHKFHESCISMWCRTHNTCPICRNSIIPENGNVIILHPLSLDVHIKFVFYNETELETTFSRATKICEIFNFLNHLQITSTYLTRVQLRYIEESQHRSNNVVFKTSESFEILDQDFHQLNTQESITIYVEPF